MSGRRSHHRSVVDGPQSGSMRVLRDVVVERMDRQELMVISRSPAVIGEEMSLQLFSASGCIALQVGVVDSRPVVIAGSLRHRLRVTMMKQGGQNTAPNRESLGETSTKPEIG